MITRATRPRPREWWVHSSAGFWLGIAVCIGVLIVDTALDRPSLIPLLVVAPLVASGSSSPQRTAIVGGVALVISVVLGWIDDIELRRGHWVQMFAVLGAGLLAVWLAYVRTTREAELKRVNPDRERADRLAFVLNASRVGSWSWDRPTGSVVWDAPMAMLFGIERQAFTGTLGDWLARVDPRDRDVVNARLNQMVRERDTVRFDCRCVWPDGSVHWLEAIGEPVTRRGAGIGGFGLAIDIDDRVAVVDERNHLLALETSARERADYLARVNAAIGETLALDEILAKVTASVVPHFADWCSVILMLDRPPRDPLIVYSHQDPAEMQRAEEVLRQFPWDPDAPYGAALVARTNEVEYVPDLEPEAFVGEAKVLAPFAIRSAITAPLRASLGTLGAVQLIRTGSRHFDEDDVELAKEIAARVASALNNAIVYARQLRTDALLETLQYVTGQCNAASTQVEIRKLITSIDWSRIGIDNAMLFLYDEPSQPSSVDSSTGVVPPDTTFDALAAEARSPVPGRLVIPLIMVHRSLGVLVLEFDPEHTLSTEEHSTFTTLSGRFAGALERARLYDNARDAALILQRRLMPTIPQLPEWLEVAPAYLPSPGGEVGGDWYQLIRATNGKVAAVVGDAVGHGLAAAAAMGQLRGAVAGAVASDPDPDRVLSATEQVAMTSSDLLYATITYMLLDDGPVARFATAGHLPPAWVRAGSRARVIEGGRRPLLGVGSPSAMPVASSAPFEVGDTLVLYTDGLVERRRESVDVGVRRLLDVLQEVSTASAIDVRDTLIDELTPGRDIEDDIALLVLRRV